MIRIALTGIAALAVSACQNSAPENDAMIEEAAGASEEASADADITLGNGENNSITLEGITRTGSVFTVPEVKIEGAGWLVMHPFRDGTPVRNEYVGSTLLPAGTSENVTIDVGAPPAEGDMFIIMLHNDVNEDGVFDFGDGEANVPDAPTFEGELLIAHPISAPADSET